MTQNRFNLPRWVLITAIVVLILSLLVTADYVYHRNRIYSGIFVLDVDVGKLSKEEAVELLSNHIRGENIDERQVQLSLDDAAWELTFAELGIVPDVAQTIDEAFFTGREKLHIFRYFDRIAISRETVPINLQWQTNPTTFATALEEIAVEVHLEPENASYELTEDRKKVEIIPDVPGQELDVDATYASLQTILSGYPDMSGIDVSVKETEAEWTAAYLDSLNVKEEIAAYQTAFSAGNQNRAHNIRLASAAIDEYLLLPGEQFSFNETVGRASADQGYRPAPVIVSGEITEGIGGGVCQVSSTLYNVVLLADVPIVERRNHSLRVAYLPPGLDATVSYGAIDFKFKNDRDHAIWIRTFVEGGQMTVRFYGSEIPGHEVKVLTENMTTIPAGEKVIQTAELPRGVREKVKDGQPGYRVSVWRVTTVNGEETKREKISDDSYRAVPAEYRVGTADIPASSDKKEKKEPKEDVSPIEEPEQENGEEEANQ